MPETLTVLALFLWVLKPIRIPFNFIRFLGGFEYKELKEKPQALTQITALPQILDH